jgi:predicted O-linked N-acetylglucosamine transferase (SPINDLY family)
MAEKSVKVSRDRCRFEHRREDVDRIKVGYVSPDFRSHAVGTLIRELFGHHDRESFEVFAYSLVSREDNVTRAIREGVDHYRDIATRSPEVAAQTVHEDGIHILIDLAGYTTHSKTELFALRPAPVQAHYLGYLDTMGADFLPYLIADEQVVTPDMEASFRESVVYMPVPFFVTSKMEDSGRAFSRSECGLPEEGFVFCCMNNQRTINPEVFDAWVRILTAVPESVLWLYDRDNVGGQANLKKAAIQRGIDPDRLVFAESVSHGDYIARYRLADLFLDTFVYSAGATAVGALQAGVPVLTRPGETMLNRMGSSIIMGAGLPELVTRSTDEYVQTAIDLANDQQRLNHMRDHLLLNRENLALFDTARWVKHFETALKLMWEDFLSGRGPQSHRVGTTDH